MKAVRYHNYGAAEELKYEDISIPEITDDEVLIKVEATSFNPVDGFIRSGWFKDYMPVTLPFTPNSDVAGVIEKAGKNVVGFKTGERVFGFLNLTKNGAAAEYVATDTAGLAIAPKSISLVDAAAVPATALTAWQGMFEHGNVKAGQRVLITAAAGGVGSFAVQFAKNTGAYVIGTASDASKPILNELGINEIINYKTEILTEALTEKVDMVFNLTPLGSEEVNKMLDVIKPGGVLVSALNPADAELAKSKGIKTIRMGVTRNSTQLKEIAALIDEGKVKPYITEKLQLKDLAEAHKKSEAGQIRGKIVITI